MCGGARETRELRVKRGRLLPVREILPSLPTFQNLNGPEYKIIISFLNHFLCKLELQAS